MDEDSRTGDASPIVTVPKEYMTRIISQFLLENAISIDDIADAVVAEERAQNQRTNVGGPIVAKQVTDDVRLERWDAVLSALLPVLDDVALAMDLFEHMARSLVANGSPEAAKALVNRAPVLNITMRRRDPARFASLVRIADQLAEPFPADPQAEEKQRLALAFRVEHFLTEFNNGKEQRKGSDGGWRPLQPARLLSYVQDALKWRKLTRGTKRAKYEWEDVDETNAIREDTNRKRHELVAGTGWSKPLEVNKMSKGVSVQCACVIPDGSTLALGTSDGFVELFALPGLKRRTDLPYQANDEPLVLENPASCLTFSLSGSLLACGDDTGKLVIFRVADGKCVSRIDTGHSNGGVGSLAFSPDQTRIATGGIDGASRIFSVTSGTRLCDCLGHESFVNSVVFLSPTRLLTGSSDEKVCIWNSATGDLVKAITVSGGKIMRAIPFKHQPTSSEPSGPACFTQIDEFTHVLVCSASKVSLVSLDTFAISVLLGAPLGSGLVDVAISRSSQFIQVIGQLVQTGSKSKQKSSSLMVWTIDQVKGSKSQEHAIPPSVTGPNGKSVELQEVVALFASPIEEALIVTVTTSAVVSFMV